MEGSIAHTMASHMSQEDSINFFLYHRGKDFLATIEIVKDLKSVQQMRFYRGVLIPALSNATGDKDYDRMHYYCKSIFLKEHASVNGEYITIIPSLANIDKVVMHDFIEAVLELIADCQGRVDVQSVTEYYEMYNEQV